ncbi:MAG: D-2-hydroxyacid dehydrogenase [Lactimicrobium sp.]|jgi:phosphoglycerate dehydrogenase-like enzyme|uniref:D-2-hydroxyacid dehydrogenase n=1 Tax=Lactimicrobium sp. TaxID=2563780 RepID=UPI002F34F490
MKILFVTEIPEDKKHCFTDPAGEDITFVSRKDVSDEQLKEAEVIMGNVSPARLSVCQHLQWLQLDSAGADAYAKLPGDFVLTNASGAYGPAISEYMLACMLRTLKRLDDYEALQASHDWVNLGSVKTLSQLTILCLGMGDIGSHFAKKVKALGAHVIGVRRHMKELPEGFDEQYEIKDLDALLPKADVIAMSLPQTPDTIHIMNKERLALCKPGSILINVGRGSAIDETALISLQKKDYFGGVCLDVFEHEPLPKNNPLWNLPHTLCTPHIAGRFNAEVTYDKVLSIFEDNLKRYLANEPLQHVVDRKLGY